MSILVTGRNKSAGKRSTLVISIVFFLLMTITIIPGVMGATAVDMGSADNFAVLAKTAITDTLSLSIITGDVGLSPENGAAIVGFDTCTPSRVSGTLYKVDDAGTTCATKDPTLVGNAVADMILAYSNASSEPIDVAVMSGQNISGQTFIPGAYSWTGAVIMSDDVTLDGQGNSNAVWLFKTSGYLTIEENKRIILKNGAQPKNIFWVVADYTTLGKNSVFNGNILDATAITLSNGAVLNGRALAQSAVTLEKSTVTLPVSRLGPVAEFSFTNATGTGPLTVAFTDASVFDPASLLNSWAWDFDNDDTIDNVTKNPGYTFYTVGDHPVNLTIIDSHGATSTKIATVTVTPPSLEITITNVPVTLALDPDVITTNDEIQFYVNSTTNWQVTAYDADPTTSGFMTHYQTSPPGYVIPATHLSQPFMVRKNTDDTYGNLPTNSGSASLIQYGIPEVSGTAYLLGVRQDVVMEDSVLPTNNVYRIVVTLNVGST